MRGIILAGGTGSRLGPLTKAVNKHLLPVADRPMIYWPLSVLDGGVTDITIVSTPRGVGQLAELLGGGFSYRVQDEPGGVVQAIACAGRSGGSVAVILGDNVFLPAPRLPQWQDHGTATCYLREVPVEVARQCGVPTFDVRNRIRHVTEKPAVPDSCYAVTGLYVFGEGVFDEILAVGRSKRGEFEVADLLNRYAENARLTHEMVDGFWGDAGTHEGVESCSAAVKQRGMTR